MNKRILSKYLLVIILAAAFPTAVFAKPVPAWMNKRPYDNQYYVGIGSSNLKNRNVDYEMALTNAKADLGAEISTQIISSLEILSIESSAKYNMDYVNKSITQYVNQEITDYEVVDSYYSYRTGYWFYIRISKANWERKQNEKMNTLRTKVKDLLNSAGNTAYEQLSAFSNARNEMIASSFAWMLTDSYDGKSVFVLDYLNTNLRKILASLTFKLMPENLTAVFGNSFKVEIIATSPSYSGGVGPIPAAFFYADKKVSSFYFDDNGKFSGFMTFPFTTSGSYPLELKPDLEVIGSKNIQELAIPSKKVLLTLNPVVVAFSVTSSNSTDYSGDFRSLFAGMPFSFQNSNQSKSAFVLRVRLTFSDKARDSGNSPYMTSVYAVVELIKEGQVIYSYQSQFAKDGAADLAGAHRRAVTRLIAAIQKDSSMFTALVDRLKVISE